MVDAGEKTSEFKAKGYLALGLTYSLQATDGEWGHPRGLPRGSGRRRAGPPVLGALPPASSLLRQGRDGERVTMALGLGTQVPLHVGCLPRARAMRDDATPWPAASCAPAPAEPALCEGMLVVGPRMQECLGLTSPRKPTLVSQGPPPPFARLSSQARACVRGRTVHAVTLHSGRIYCFSRCVLG